MEGTVNGTKVSDKKAVNTAELTETVVVTHRIMLEKKTK